MLLWLILMAGVPILGGYYLMRGKAKSLARLKDQVDADVRGRLGAVAAAVGGSVIDGPTLKVPRGQLSLVASGAPNSLVIDIARFAGKTPVLGLLTIVRVEDAKKVMATKNLRVLAEHACLDRYHVLVSDPEKGKAWMSAAVGERLAALETAVRARCRVQRVNGMVTILAFRGLARPEEIRAFCEGSSALLEALEAAG